MPEVLRIEISCLKPGEWRVIERTHHAAENMARVAYHEVELRELLGEIRQCLLDADADMNGQHVRLRRLGSRLAEMTLPAALREKVSSWQSPIEFFLDDISNILPVELFPSGETVLADALPVSRHWFCENASVPPPKRTDKILQVLIVADPAEDLPDAQKEGEYLFRKIRGTKELKCRYLGRAVTCAELSRELPDSNILHIAAHYRAGNLEDASGVALSDGLWMPSANTQTPELVFANCCRAGLTTSDNGSLSLVGHFLQSGSRHVIAPFLPVPDRVGLAVAKEFYHSLTSGVGVSEALLSARRLVGPSSWLYWYFGSTSSSSSSSVFMQQQNTKVRSIIGWLLILFMIVAMAWFLFPSNQSTPTNVIAEQNATAPTDTSAPRINDSRRVI